MKKEGNIMFYRRIFDLPNWGDRKLFSELDIQVTSNGISISGERKIQEEGNNVRYHRREREAGKFSRLINLSGDVDVNKVDACLKNGILTVTIPKI
jgi:HSP20 family protein